MGPRKLPIELRTTVIFLTLFCCLELCSSSLLPNVNGVTYRWKTRPWGSCSSHVSCGESHRRRQVRCQDSDGLVVADANCDDAARPSSVERCFRVCEEHRSQLRWLVGDWSPCVPSTNTCAGGPLAGVARRSVSCVWSRSLRPVAPSACEQLWDRPEAEAPCSVDCPQDCVTAAANVTCRPMWCPEEGSWNVQVTEVVVAPTEGGKKCPDLDQNPLCPPEFLSRRFCKSKVKQESKYILKISKWSPCEAAESNDIWSSSSGVQISLKPVIGISQRNISCLNEKGKTVNISLCVGSGTPLSRRCVVPVPCRTSPWSEWHVRAEGCISSDGRVHPEVRSRSRRVEQMPAASFHPCPPLYEEREVRQDLPSCYKYQWYPTEWSECEVRVHGPHNRLNVTRPTCGNGLQYRSLLCVRASDSSPVSEELCRESRPASVQQCHVPCRRDCQVSHWSRWGPCTFDDNGDIFYNLPQPQENRNQQEGWMRRERSVLVSPSAGGRPCPHLQESDTCPEIGTVSWQYGAWGPCVLKDPQASCGMGLKRRSKTCLNIRGEPIDKLMCTYHHPSFDNVPCRVPCPDDCVLSEWSEWSVCTLRCSSGLDDGELFRNKTYLAKAGPEGTCWNDKDSDSDYCNTFLCKPYRWVSDEWGACQPLDDLPSSQSCSAGVQTREVHCFLQDDLAKSDKMCNYLRKPETSRECFLPCPVDCVTTNFTEWGPCDSECDEDAVQYKERFIVQSARHGGRECPEALREARSCRRELDSVCLERNTFRWNTTEWSQCTMPTEEQRCGMGLQIREVSCVDESGEAVPPHRCLSETGWTLPYVPAAVRSCELTCPSGCVLTAWSSWTDCGYAYGDKRRRKREVVGPTAANCSFKLVEEEACPPASPSESSEERGLHWMSCLLHNGTGVLVNGQLRRDVCGEGYRYRFDWQLNDDTGTGPGIVRDFCMIDCPIDCQMSEWSDWTPCDVPCGKGFRERRREVLVPANYLGRPCPVTNTSVEIQRDVCHTVCSDFSWHAEGWTRCRLKKRKSPCGDGVQYRTVKCLEKWSEKEVNESMCDPLLKPEVTSECSLHCPGECVVSPWTVTEKCSEPCSSSQHLVERREVLRQPNGSSPECPPLERRSPCLLNTNCWEHLLSLGPWGSCGLPPGAACGESVVQRPLVCTRSDGRQVDLVHCEKGRHTRLAGPASKPCYAECPLDCIMSQWSAWNKSECKPCGAQGTMHRSRRVLQLPSGAGQPCSPVLEQRTPCEFKACYHWRHTDWSPCDLQGAECGHGVRRRVTECLRYDGLKVDKLKCLTVNLTFPIGSYLDAAWLSEAQEDSYEEDSCEVPCPGQCIISEWSKWSHCQKNCRIGQIVGYQTSTRKILYSDTFSSTCPTQLLRTRPCWSDDCNFFRWKLKNGSLICEGRDGIAVEGGCGSESVPCEQWCEKLGGSCNGSSGMCRCGVVLLSGPDSRPCPRNNGPRPPADHSAPTNKDFNLKYYPDDNQVSFWMYAMISIGTAFVIFVVVTVYLMCRSSLRQRSVSVERQPSMRRRANTNGTAPVGNPYTDIPSRGSN